MVSQNVAEIIKNHVVLEVEGIDRMYLNGYVPGLQTEGGFVHFVHKHLGFPIASTAVISPLSKAFVHAIEVFAKELQVDLITFDKNQRKIQPRPGHRPLALDGGGRNAHYFRRLLDRHAAEEAELDDATLLRIERFQPRERGVEHTRVDGVDGDLR